MTDSKFVLSAATILDISRALDAGTLSSERLVQLYASRIEAYDKQGPQINAVINLNTRCLETARNLDKEREQTGPRSLLHGVPVVLKDIIDVEGMPTTGGFAPLAESYPVRDAAVTKKLRTAGAVVLAKVNANDWFGRAGMSESTLGGQTRNPHNLDYTPGGSSCGSGAAVAANYAPLGIGTDTSGSVLMPSADNGLFGLLPSRGLISRAGIIPITPTLDRVGMMARSAFDLAALFSCLVGWDPEDMTTNDALEHFPGQAYEAQLSARGLAGFCIGVLREMWQEGPRYANGAQIIADMLGRLRNENAVLVDPVLTGINLREVATLESGNSSATSYELLASTDAYLARLGPSAPFKNVREIIEQVGIERLKGRFREALTLPAPEQSDYYLSRRRTQTMLRNAIVELIRRHRLDVVALPYSLAGPSRIGQRGGFETNSLASHAGLPSIVVPAGYTREGLPIGLQFIAEPYRDTTLLQLAHVIEQVSGLMKLPEATPALPGEQL